MGIEYKFDKKIYLLDILERLISLHFESATYPEEYEAWSDFSEEYDKLIFVLIETFRTLIENDKK